MENYKEKYEMALEGVQEILSSGQDSIKMSQLALRLHGIFPELGESEYERIRKRLIDLIYKVYAFTNYITCVEYENIIAWLEKQGYSKKDIDAAYLKGICDAKNELGKQGEQKPAVTDFNAKDWYVSKVDGKIHDMTYNPADKVEPKFKVGDWVVKGDTIAQILDIQEQYYVGLDINGKDFTSSRFLNDDKIHLWTIQDAKDGDVLAIEPIERYNSPFIAIYKKQNEEDFDSYCFIGFDGKFYKGENGHSTKEVHPAIKEQRDLLFQKMKEAGYEWDAEKKELKKIKQEFTESPKDYHDIDPHFGITEDYCSYEVAKLLKEKGFEGACDYAYSNKGNYFEIDRSNFDEVYCFRPTHQMAMKWLREVHKVLIVIDAYHADHWEGYIDSFEISIYHYASTIIVPNEIAHHTDYEKAVEAALKYTLEKLI